MSAKMFQWRRGGLMVSAFVSESSGPGLSPCLGNIVKWEIIVLCPCARHFTFAVPRSTQVYRQVSANLMLGLTQRWTSPHPGGSRNIPRRFMIQNLKTRAGMIGHLAWLVCRLAHRACSPLSRHHFYLCNMTRQGLLSSYHTNRS